MDEDWRLLDDYAATGSHAAFDALVSRHADLVYGSARRRVGSAELADEVTQATFIVLARKARSLGRRQSLSAWLYRVARYAAINALRRRSTRLRHERRAARPEAVMPDADDSAHDKAADFAPHLDAALDGLPARDREAVLLRYFKNHTLEQIGHSQRVAASTVQRRLERSLARLAHDLKRRGAAPASTAALATALAAAGLTAAPASATLNLTALATAGPLPAAGGAAGLAQGTLKTMAMIKLKIAAAVAAGIVTLGAGGVAIDGVLAQSRTVQTQAPTAEAPTAAAGAAGAGAASDLSQQLTAEWRAASLNVTQANPAATDKNVPQTSRSLTIDFGIVVRDASSILGFDRNGMTEFGRVIDAEGRDVRALVVNRPRDNRSYAPLQYGKTFDDASQSFVDRLLPQLFNVPLSLSDALPQRIARLEGSAYVLRAERIETIDVPFKAASTYTDIMPGLRVRFDEAVAEEGRYHFRLATEPLSARRREPPFNGSVSARSPLPARIVTHWYFVDAAGKHVGGQRYAGAFGFGTGGMSGSGGDGPGTVAAMRFEVAVNPYEQPAAIVLTDIDLPRLKLAAGLLPADTPRRDLTPVQRMEAALIRQLDRRRSSPTAAWDDAKDARMRELWKAFVADFDNGAVAMKPAAVMDVTPDAATYDDYVGAYRALDPHGGPAQPITVRKDERGRFIVESPEGPSPAAARDGALFCVFDDVLIAASDPLDPKSSPKLAGFWIVRSVGTTSVRMDTGRPAPPITLEPAPRP
ncbi:MAG TPA: sigma-70 family RNA polymerase sigma factor [Tepidisphaeraceae bacterium]|jgi:RNA polymerase sigma factor (sigma-70 family)